MRSVSVSAAASWRALHTAACSSSFMWNPGRHAGARAPAVPTRQRTSPGQRSPHLAAARTAQPLGRRGLLALDGRSDGAADALPQVARRLGKDVGQVVLEVGPHRALQLVHEALDLDLLALVGKDAQALRQRLGGLAVVPVGALEPHGRRLALEVAEHGLGHVKDDLVKLVLVAAQRQLAVPAHAAHSGVRE